MIKSFSFLLLLTLGTSLSAQFYDNHWMLGYAGGDQSAANDSFGVSILSFFDAELRIVNNQEIDLFFQDGNTLSDSEGNLLMYSNNREIRNAQDQLIVNGLLEQNGDSEQILPQTFVYLPFDSFDLVHYVQMTYTNGFPQLGQNLSSSFINTRGTIGIFEQIENILPDALSTGELTACRHANGRDWWVLATVANEPFVYSALLNPDGVTLTDTMAVAYDMQSGLGQAKFSPDGNHYIRYNNVRIGADDYLDIFDFDRGTGQLSNHRHTNVGSDARAGGIAVSPSSQYLYVSHYNHVFQYDLWAGNIFNTKDTVAIYDGFQEWNSFSSRFYLAELAPDGKIYLNSPTSLTKLHVIESPDEKGLACDVRQHSIHLPNYNISTLANHPNYRLGPIDGSPSDTLGIDNLPIAYYRIDRSPEDTLSFSFQDLSFYEPMNWSWTFGDGGSSNDRYPIHSYISTGIYEVCLTVSNDLGSDTHCRTIELGPVGVEDQSTLIFTTFPNPVQDVLVLDSGDYMPLNGRFKLYDAAGREVFSQQVLYRQASFNLSNLSAGIYYYSYWDQGKKLDSGKVIREN
ncbi:PKD domain-containing protein [Neolewinella aurantiaca]|uniref:PKD domain-containing protein n=1 Tax=Neolewinella aurantiaca TaxID=2602767 RepID=A0A5C7FSQ1_9BACT|nr:PKD domain-containing protein [Neolewinella aurantiaca]TXF89272.1 PKD domain-containing protein [Neolewinella aurantiaca]